jgi:metal-responsive CopG/Arc/MetJ family transcriptional regulator
MTRRIRDRTAPIHITLPVSLVNKLDSTLSINQSRSRKIANLIQNHLEGEEFDLRSMPTKQLLVAIRTRYNQFDTEYQLLSTLISLS